MPSFHAFFDLENILISHVLLLLCLQYFSWLPVLLIAVCCFLLYFAFQELLPLALGFLSPAPWTPKADS